MTNNFKNLFVFFLLLFSAPYFGNPKVVKASGYCYCENREKTLADCRYPGGLIQDTCYSNDTSLTCKKALANGTLPAEAVCEKMVAQFNEIRKGNINNPGSGGSNNSGSTNVTGGSSNSLASKLIPDCVMQNKLSAECKDISIFFELMLKIINYLFSIIGGVALLFFVYGGFVFVLSQGNAEKVSQGKAIIVSAVLGIIIAFSGYAIVRIVGDMVGIKNEFKLDK